MTATLPAPAAPQQGLLAANLLCMASMMIWAAGLPAADLIIPLLPAEQLGALRMGLAAAFLLPFWLLVEGVQPLRRAGWRKGIAIGGMIALGAWFLVIGQARSDAVTAAVISATLPVVGIALEVALDGRRLGGALVAGLALSLAGGLMALDFAGGGLALGIGALFCFLSVVAFAFGSRLTVTAFPGLSPIGRTALTISGGSVVALALAAGQIALDGPGPGFAGWGWREAGALLAYSVGSLGICQILWIAAIGRLGIGLSALHINAAPFYVMLILFAFGGGWDWTRAGAAALVAFGVLVAQGIVPFRGRSGPAPA